MRLDVIMPWMQFAKYIIDEENTDEDGNDS